MPTRAKLTIIGLYNYAGDDLFQNCVFPSGVNRQVAINKILYDNGPLELVIPDPEYLKTMLGYWSTVNSYKWETMLKTTQLTYNPIYNVDADETETVTRTLTGSSDNTRTLDTASTDDNTRTLNTTDTGSNTSRFAGFNSSTMPDVSGTSGSMSNTGTITDDRDTTETGTITDAGTHTDVNTITDAGRGSETSQITDVRTIADTGTVKDERDISNTGTVKDERDTTETGTIADNRDTTETGTIADEGSRSESETITTERTRQGNIGVTMTQQMIQAERDVARFSIYDVISADFKLEFCIMVY